MIRQSVEQDARLLQALEYDLGLEVRTWLHAPGCEDITLNGDGVLWVKVAGEGFKSVGQMTSASAYALITAVARLRGLEANHAHPRLETILPTDGSRFEALLPPITPAPIFAIRRRASRVYSLADYVRDGILDVQDMHLLLDAIENRDTILISGSTGSGKTTLLNACLASFPESHRVAIIEDTPELQCSSPNHVSLLASDKLPIEECLKAALRLIPDRIVVGEVRGPEALPMLKAFNTGHPGGLATIHANSPKAAMLQLNLRVREAIPNYDASSIAAEAIQVIVQIDGPRKDRDRRVTEVVRLCKE